MSSRCQCLKVDGSQCSRQSNPSNQNPLFCWQHQQCLKTNQLSQIIPVIKPSAKIPLIIKTSPIKIPVKIPVKTPVKTPAKAPAQAPTQTPTKNPIKKKPKYISVVGPTIYSLGHQCKNSKEVPTMDLLGFGVLDLAPRQTDPDAKAIWDLHRIEYLTVDPKSIKSKPLSKKLKCLSAYEFSAITFESVADIIKANSLNVIDIDQRCLVVSDLIMAWRHGLTVIDSQSKRVKPQYPRDIITNEIMLPRDIYQILNRGAHLGLIKQDDTDPLWYISKDSNLLTDIYNFIKFKFYLEKAYNQIKKPDLGAWNRRDLILIDRLKSLYTRYQIQPWGWRLYTDILSGSTGIQVFETCLLVAKLNEKFTFVNNQWIAKVKSGCQLIKTKDSCRTCVSFDIITSEKSNIDLFN